MSTHTLTTDQQELTREAIRQLRKSYVQVAATDGLITHTRRSLEHVISECDLLLEVFDTPNTTILTTERQD